MLENLVNYAFFFSCLRFGDKGTKAIAEALKTNTTLTDLDIGCIVHDHLKKSFKLNLYRRFNWR